MYQQLYDLIVQYVYGGQIVDQFQQLVCTEYATAACILMMSLPFVTVYYVIKIVARTIDSAFGGGF